MVKSRTSALTLVISATGIVYGDIGTSVLYALRQVFASGRVPLTPDNLYGVLSLLFWTLILIVTIKYVTLILRADNKGEGGTLALLALALQSVGSRPALRRTVLVVGIIGAALFYGDGVITPAISVLSAIEGMKLIAPWSKDYVLLIALCVLLPLFLIQKQGTGGIGRGFGPIMLAWFFIIGVLGLGAIVHHPEILWALLPQHALTFIWHQPWIAFLALGAIVLCVTGVEALYADLGHFGRRPMQTAWFTIVMPALVLNYFGQGALLLADPAALRNPFYLLAPTWALMPLVVLATIATVIASQALISGVFSMTKQAIQLGYLPRLHIEHTSMEAGQVYVPVVNWTLFAAVVASIFYFRSAEAMASAYGVAICGLMLISTLLFCFVVYHRRRPHVAVTVIVGSLFLLVDGFFLTSAMLKTPTGGWFPLVLAAMIFMLMTTWHQGQRALRKARADQSLDLTAIVTQLLMEPPVRVPGTAVYLSASQGKTPAAFLHNLKHNKVLHERNLFVTLRHLEVPHADPLTRTSSSTIGPGVEQIILDYGFKEEIDIPRDLAALKPAGGELRSGSISYFLGRDTVLAGPSDGLVWRWQKKLFIHMHRNAAEITDFMRLPKNAVVELGGMIEI